MSVARWIASTQERTVAAEAVAWLRTHPGEGAPQAVAGALRALAARIDQTLLEPTATPDQIRLLCRESAALGVAIVCVSPIHVLTAANELRGTAIAVASAVGFPTGAHHAETKAAETRRAIEDGATEIDMVAPIELLRAGDSDEVERHIAAVVEAAEGRIVKVILETASLTEAEKIEGVSLARGAGAAFVKTSTGTGPGGATLADVSLLRREAGAVLGVKASGGIRTTIVALEMIAAGADRIGTSAARSILEGPHEPTG